MILSSVREGLIHLPNSNSNKAICHLLQKKGIDQINYASHSFRIGAATTAAAAGLPAWLIKTLGRWNSNAYLAIYSLSQYCSVHSSTHSIYCRYNSPTSMGSWLVTMDFIPKTCYAITTIICTVFSYNWNNYYVCLDMLYNLAIGNIHWATVWNLGRNWAQ